MKQKIQKLAGWLTALSVGFSLFAVPVFAEANTYHIKTAEELSALAEEINDGKNSDAAIELENDLVIPDSWTPLGKNSMFPFRGSFDGNGYSVTVTVDDPTLKYFGFFGCLENAVVEDLTVRGEIYCSEPYAYVGGLSARARGNITLKNCTNEASVSALARGSEGIGGLIGGYDDGIEYRYENIRMVLENCVNDGTVMVTGSYNNTFAGGLVGSNKNCVQLSGCTNNGTVYAPGIYVGGLLGQAGSSMGDYSPLISDCVSNGTLVGAKGKVGRLWGKGTVTNTTNSGNNTYTGSADLDDQLLSEAQKAASVISVSSDVAVGDSISYLKDGQTISQGISVLCSQGKRDIKHGYLTFDEDQITLAKQNATGQVVTETATLQWTNEKGASIRKPITILIYPSSDAKTELMHRIANTYKNSAEEWVVFDMAVYETLGFGKNTTDYAGYQNKTANQLSKNTPLSSDRAKAEIILSALNIDTTSLTPYQGETYSNPEKLQSMNLGSSYYAAPWILLAEEAGQVTLTSEQQKAMIQLLLDAQGENGLFFSIWGNEKYDDADTTGTALAALARFSEDPSVQAFTEKAVSGLSQAQGENGSFGNINTDAMVIIGLAAMGINPAKDTHFQKSGGTLADAVMLYANDSKDGFTTSYVSGTQGDKARALATEQGFRALLVLEQLKSCNFFNVYTQVSKGGTAVTVPKALKPFAAATDDGLSDDSKDQPETPGESDSEMTVFCTVSTHESDWLSDSYTMPEGATIAELLQKAFKEANMSAEGLSKGYITSVTKDGETLAQLDKGSKSGWMYTVNGDSPTVGISDYVLKSGDRVKLYYTVDYTQDAGSKKWSGGSMGSSSAGSSAKTDLEKTDNTSLAPAIEWISQNAAPYYLILTPAGVPLFPAAWITNK